MPVEGGPVKKIHGADLRLCVPPVPTPYRKGSITHSNSADQIPASIVKGSPDPEYVVLEEAPCLDVDPGLSRAEALHNSCVRN